MRIDLYNPPTHYYTHHLATAYPVLSLPILAAVLNKAGHEARVFDLERMKVQPDKYFNPPWPDVIGFTSLTHNIKGVEDSISVLREKGYSGRVVVGGIYATLYPEKVLSMGADLVVTGECEGNLSNLLNSCASGIQAGRAVPIEDVPIPDWEHYNPSIKTYKGNWTMNKDRPGITMWSRGCPFSCAFCENKIFQRRKTQYRPPENIAAEMEVLKSYGLHDIFIYDDETVGGAIPSGWMSDVADRVGGMGFNMMCQGRCSQKHITPELMRDAKRAGINTVFWGVESFSQTVLNAMNKQITTDDIWHTLRTAKAAGVKNGLYLMVGCYKERWKEAMETIDAVRRAVREGLVDYANVFVMKVQPGTELEEIARREGWKNINVDTPWMSNKEIMQYRAILQDLCHAGAL